MKLTTMVKLFGSVSDRTKNLNLCHQDLLEMKGALTRFEDLPMEAFVMFVSHQWLGYEHPDPRGVQINTLCSVLRRLRSGNINCVSTDAFHVRLYQHSFRTHASEWRTMLSNAYVWFDFWSQPQPTISTCAVERLELETSIKNAILSMPSYVERSDCLVILTPGAVHHDQFDKTTNRRAYKCYRTFRKRASCVFEMFAAYLSRRKSTPTLLIRSLLSDPVYVSPLDCQKLAVGLSTFRCCEQNHTSTSCSRHVTRDSLDCLIKEKIKHLFHVKNVTMARWFVCMYKWWLRGLPQGNIEVVKMEDFDIALQWRKQNGDNEWYDRFGRTKLFYACVGNHESIVNLILRDIQSLNKEDRISYVNSKASKKPIIEIGAPGGCTALFAAMAWASPFIVSMLLKHGADPRATDEGNRNVFMYASFYGRTDNLKMWMETFPDWDVSSRELLNGNTALSLAIGFGPYNCSAVEFLLDVGLSVSSVLDSGLTMLMLSTWNEDSDVDVLNLILKRLDHDALNIVARSRTLKWKVLRSVAKALCRANLTGSRLVQRLAHGDGVTALHYAARRGDVEIVSKLLASGANPQIQSAMGCTPSDVSDAFPELRGMLEKRERIMMLRGTGKKTGAVEVLGKRISTATPIQHEMWLISLETLLMLYGEGSHGHVMEVHQKLRDKFLTPWHSVPSDAEIIFVSTQSLLLSLTQVTFNELILLYQT